MTALLERERELAELATIVGETCAGQGRIVVVEASAGMGKTRLLQAARERGSEAGLRVLGARATELERDFPFALVRQLFEPRLAALTTPERDALFEGASAAARGALGLVGDAASGAPAGDTFAVLHGLYWLTVALAETQPLLLAVDDAHWADDASLDYFAFLLPRLEELPVLLAVACRPDEPGAPARLARIATDTVARRLVPCALSRTAAATLLATELGTAPADAFADECHAASGGNPFLLCELARTLAQQDVAPGVEQARLVRELTPERVSRTVLLRVARLSPQAAAVARALVVLGDDSELPTVAALAGIDAAAALRGADELRTAAVLDPGAPLRFIHPLVRNAISSELAAGERADAHARAGDLLRAQGAGPEQLAAHLLATEARGDRATVETLVAAGTSALANGAPRSSIAYLTRALREPPPAELRAAVLHPLISATIRAADHAAFDAIEADVLAELERTPALRSRWATKLTGWMMLTGRTDQAIALLEQAIAVAVAEGDVDRAFRHEAQMTTIASLSPAESRARLEPYRDRIAPGSSTERLMAAVDARWVTSHGSADEAAALARRALGDDGWILFEQPELMAPGEVVVTLAMADKVDEARRHAEQALVYARKRGAMAELAGAWSLLAVVEAWDGDLTAAEADMRQAVSVARLGELHAARVVLTGPLVLILNARGDFPAAAAALDGIGMAEAPVPDLGWFASLQLGRGMLRYLQGRPRDAADDLVELYERKQRWGIAGSPWLPAGSFAAIALTACGEVERARELAETDLAHAERWGSPTTVGFAQAAAGVALGGPAGIARLKEAVTTFRGPGSGYRVQALVMLGSALRRANRRAEARAPLREALDIARRCGAMGNAKIAHDELAATGERVRRYTPIGVESLTPSERRVAEMAASGLTNRQVAQALFVTIKTIETHLAAAYDKLGIRSRAQLPDALTAPAPSAAG